MSHTDIKYGLGEARIYLYSAHEVLKKGNRSDAEKYLDLALEQLQLLLVKLKLNRED